MVKSLILQYGKWTFGSVDLCTVRIEGRDAVFACCSGANIHSITTWPFTYTLKYLTNEGPPWWLTMIDWPIGGRHCKKSRENWTKKFIATEQKHQDAKTASRPSIRTVIQSSVIYSNDLLTKNFSKIVRINGDRSNKWWTPLKIVRMMIAPKIILFCIFIFFSFLWDIIRVKTVRPYSNTPCSLTNFPKIVRINGERTNKWWLHV